MAGKTVAISDEVHTMISKKKTELFEKHKVSVRIADIADRSIVHGINKACEEFVPNVDKKLRIVKKEEML